MSQKRKAPPRGASRRQEANRRPIPGWLWMLAGLALGLFSALLLQLLPHRTDVREVVPATTPPESVVTPPPKEAPPQPVFDFYTRLAENEVKVIESGQRKEPAAAPVTRPAQPALQPPVATPDRYLLQAGSFRRTEDADRLRAELLLLGLDARIKKVRVENGNEWHRVQVGPFASSSELQQARTTLTRQGITPLVLKLK